MSKKFYVTRDRKVVAWTRESAVVEADSLKEAQRLFSEDKENVYDRIFEYLPETEQPLTLIENMALGEYSQLIGVLQPDFQRKKLQEAEENYPVEEWPEDDNYIYE